jgi:hypothetical protein
VLSVCSDLIDAPALARAFERWMQDDLANGLSGKGLIKETRKLCDGIPLWH